MFNEYYTVVSQMIGKMIYMGRNIPISVSNEFQTETSRRKAHKIIS